MRVSQKKLLIVGMGGTTRPGSSSEKLLRYALAAAAARGAETIGFCGPDLNIPMYAPELPERDEKAVKLVEALRRADGVIIASPGYHGSISGLVKNALDYVEDTRADPRVYFDGVAVGCITAAYGYQAAVVTLTMLRSITHALRGWPTPLGVAANSMGLEFEESGAPKDSALRTQLEMLAGQVVDFASRKAG